MRHLKVLVLLLIIGLFAACVPAVEVFDPREGARAFTLNVDGRTIEADGSIHRYHTDVFEIDFELGRRFIRMELVNGADSTMRLHLDRSAVVLPDGSSSRLVSGRTSWATRDDPQAPIVIPTAAKASESLIPRTNLTFSSARGLQMHPMFEWPLEARTVIRVILALEVGDEITEVSFTFEGRPLPEEDVEA